VAEKRAIPLIPLQGHPSENWVAYAMHHLVSPPTRHSQSSVGSRPGGIAELSFGEKMIGLLSYHVHSVRKGSLALAGYANIIMSLVGTEAESHGIFTPKEFGRGKAEPEYTPGTSFGTLVYQALVSDVTDEGVNKYVHVQLTIKRDRKNHPINKVTRNCMTPSSWGQVLIK
jgi:hypothetical protein